MFYFEVVVCSGVELDHTILRGVYNNKSVGHIKLFSTHTTSIINIH